MYTKEREILSSKDLKQIVYLKKGSKFVLIHKIELSYNLI